MKTIIRVSLMVVIALSTAVLTSAQTKKNKKEQRQEAFENMQQIIEKDSLIFVPQRAFPQGFPSVDLTTNYGFIKLRGTEAESDMPFFGRGFTPELGGEGGVKFKGTMENVKVELNEKKKTIRYSFEVNDKDHYRVSMEIGYSGNTSVSVNSNRRSFISYNGEISKLEEEKK